MLRRAVAASSSIAPPRSSNNNNNAAAAAAALPLHTTTSSRRKKAVTGPYKLSSDAVVIALLGTALVLSLAAYMVPSWSWQQQQQQPPRLMQKAEQAVEHEIAALWQQVQDKHAHLPPIAAEQHPQLQGHVETPVVPPPVAAKSSVTGVSWVEGEQRLKAALTKLAERQAVGLDIGVPVLTRYLGPDVPAWPGDGDMTEEAWKAAVQAKYAAMRDEETAWRTQMGDYLASHPGRG